MNSESSFLRYLANNHGDIFTTLPERSWFNRKCKQLLPVCVCLQQDFVHAFPNTALRIIDSTPIPVVRLYRGGYTPCFKRGVETNYGYCASKKEYYYGVKLSLLVTTTGLITNLGIHPANYHDLKAAKDMLQDVSLAKITLIGDKGYYDGELRTTLQHHAGQLVVPDKKRHTVFNTSCEQQLLTKRSIVETVNEQLKAHMHVHETLAQSYRGLVARIWWAILAFTFGMYHNQRQGRSLLSLKSILI